MRFYFVGSFLRSHYPMLSQKAHIASAALQGVHARVTSLVKTSCFFD
jgi:hypothetical protein